ncbi:M23 family metallopeptidase [Odoribacter sp. AF15-53]|uniref:M23 family metallopeptidase n=1 Tax=Odoribacter sp. AF15-53 TaxID=2292236 RepID=UPI000E4FB8F2|nr:M23 family metallopeptidase [Odoribacter sp. AF15-53]RHR79105.1 M23 family peptidase [Odoribacter sp. AF15-53]
MQGTLSLYRWIFLWLFVCCSCSQKHLTKVPATFPTPVLQASDLLKIPDLYSCTQPQITEFFVQTYPITETFNAQEKRYVQAGDPLLFSRARNHILDLDQIPDDEFSFPLPGARVLSSYGKRNGRMHTGIDLKTFAKDTVRATFSGIVRVAGKAQGYGNVIVVRHYNGLETVYSHNFKHLVKSGDRVNAGDPLALVGRTGRATTEHVHFETRINGKHFNPAILIDFEKQAIRLKCIVFTKDRKGIIRITPIL